MDLGLKGRTALVAGASSGLGEAAATVLAAEGAEVIIVARSDERLLAAAERIEKKTGRRSECLSADLSSEDGLARIVRRVQRDDVMGAVDILVSNAGGPPPGQFTDLTHERWEEASRLVLFSAIGLTRAVIEGMKSRGWGRLIYITSIGVLQPIDDLILSNTFRAGVTGFCKTLSNTMAKHGITANCVCPGYTATDRLRGLAAKRAEQAGKTVEEVMGSLGAEAPVGRVGRPEELAALIAFLASDRAAYITGVSIPVDGGLMKALI